MRCVRYSPWIALVALAGCQTHPQVNAHIDTVNAEYRQLEDYVYCLEDEVTQLQQQLADLRSGRADDPRTQPGTGRGGLFRRRPESVPRSGGPEAPSDAPQIEVPGGSSPSLPPGGSRSRLQRPDLSPPADSPPVIELPPPAAIPSPPGQIRPAAGERLLSADNAAKPTDTKPTEIKPTDTKITHITLSPVLTGGTDFDSQPGDDGICVVIEPRNAGEEYVPEAGPISLVVLDPSRQGDAARVARWDFDLSATRQKLAGSALASGIKLELPWPATPPAANRLHLFVRYETADGRKLQTDREIFLTPPGQISSRWTPRTVQRQLPTTVAPAPIAEAVGMERSSAPAEAGRASLDPSHLSVASTDSLPAAKPAPPASLSGDESAAGQPRPTWSPHR